MEPSASRTRVDGFRENNPVSPNLARAGGLQPCFVRYGQAWYAHRTPPLPAYLRQFWVAHLQAAGAWELMRTVLTAFVPTDRADHHTQPWAAARYAAEGSYAGYLIGLWIALVAPLIFRRVGLAG